MTFERKEIVTKYRRIPEQKGVAESNVGFISGLSCLFTVAIASELFLKQQKTLEYS